MSEKIVLVTGTSSGVGLAVAVGAAAAGHRVVATLREPARADALQKAAAQAGVSLDVQRLDVTDGEAVGPCVERVVAEYGRLDVLVNNAGAGHVATTELDPMADVRATMEVNFFGVVALTRAALPHLRASGGQVITVTSVGGIVGQPFNDAYCAAKFAVEGMMESLAPVAASVGVGVTVVEPGAIATEFLANLGVVPEQLLAEAGPYSPALMAYLARTQEQFGSSAQTADEVAAAVLQVLAAESPAFRVQTSPVAAGFVGVKLADLDGSAVQGLTRSWVS